MSSSVVIGDTAPDANGKFTAGEGAIGLNVERLVETRLLIQANSGGGKSWALRRLLEQTHGRLQHLVIDPEGEFATLRERFDYVLAAKSGGDTAADPRAARLLAEKLLELNVSAILDIYELKTHERVRFVRGFLEALVDAPKALWHPALVVVDEAHVYCPQAGEAESAGAVIDLCTRGRKRGFCAVLATQRLSKLHKDAAAELNNKLIGRTGLDLDVRRACDELGFGKEHWPELRQLEAGEFYAYGPAISGEVLRLRVGKVQTTHPKSGARRSVAPPKPSATVLALLPKLADLPAEQEQRQRTLDELKADNARLRRELAQQPKPKAAPAPKPPKPPREVHVLSPADLKRWEAVTGRVISELGKTRERLERFEYKRVESITTYDPQPNAPGRPWTKDDLNAMLPAKAVAPEPTRDFSRAVRAIATDSPLPPGERAVLTAAAQRPEGVKRDQLSVLTGYKRSSRDAYVSRLAAAGRVVLRGNLIVATRDGVDALGSGFEPLPTGQALREYWLNKLPPGERAVLEVVIAEHPQPVTRDHISRQTEYKRSSRDAYLSRLSARRIVEVQAHGMVAASPELFA